MHAHTRSKVVHTTTITSEGKNGDGGRALLLELFDDLHSDRRVGKLVAQFGVGGSIASLQFEETESIPQQQIEVEEPLPPIVKRYM